MIVQTPTSGSCEAPPPWVLRCCMTTAHLLPALDTCSTRAHIPLLGVTFAHVRRKTGTECGFCATLLVCGSRERMSERGPVIYGVEHQVRYWLSKTVASLLGAAGSRVHSAISDCSERRDGQDTVPLRYSEPPSRQPGDLPPTRERDRESVSLAGAFAGLQ